MSVLIEEAEVRDLARMRGREKELDKAIGARVEKARKDKGLTRKQLAEQIGLDAGSIFKYERGERGFSPKQLGKVAVAVGKSLEWIVNGVEFDVSQQAKSAFPRLVTTIQEAHDALVPLGFQVPTDSSIPQPILDLLNLGWANPLTNEDILRLRIHLSTGGSPLPHDLEVAVRAHRLQIDGSDENVRALNDANRRRAEAMGGKRLIESEIPPPPPSRTQDAVNDQGRAKHIGPRPRRRKDSRHD